MSADTLVIPADNRILYFGRDRATFGFLSHFHSAPILLDGEVWPTVEHYYQAQKSPDPAYRQAIRDAATPGRAKRLAAPNATPCGPGSSWRARAAAVRQRLPSSLGCTRAPSRCCDGSLRG